MITTSRYGNTNQKKNTAGPGLNEGTDVIASATMTGTELTDASAATTARRGGVGTTTVKSKVHTATHDSPRKRSRAADWLRRSAGSAVRPARELEMCRLG